MHPEVQSTVQYSYDQVKTVVEEFVGNTDVAPHLVAGVLDRLAQLFPDGVTGNYTMGDIYAGLVRTGESDPRVIDEVMANIRRAQSYPRSTNPYDREEKPVNTFADETYLDGRLDIRDVVTALFDAGLATPAANEIINNAIANEKERTRWTCLTVKDISITDMGKEVKLELDSGGAQRRGRLTDYLIVPSDCPGAGKSCTTHVERYFFIIGGKHIQVAMDDVIYVDHNSKEKRD